jgi:hypothetical protein
MFQLKTTRGSLLIVTGLAMLLGACRAKHPFDPRAATRENFTRAMLAYLAARGELCLGKEFPLDVTEREFQLRARNAVQMPVLEHLGLVTSRAATGQITTEDGVLSVPVTRFELTQKGRQSYRTEPALGKHGHGDLCVANLSLDKVVSWEVNDRDSRNAVVSYTYHVDAAPWASVAEVKAVFPAVDRVVAGAGKALLEEGFTLTNDGWVVNELVPPESTPVALDVR